jgi:hypothetical protein
MKKSVVLGVALALIAMPVMAQQPENATTGVQTATEVAATPSVNITAAAQAAAQARQTLVNNTGVRLGRIVRANDDGSVGIIFNGQFVTIPASTLSVSNDRLVTSLSRVEVNRLTR